MFTSKQVTYHQHQWEEVQRKVHSPRTIGKFETEGWSDDLRALLFGYTLIEERCKDCGQTTITRHVGALPAPTPSS